MNYRDLGRTGWKVSEISFGAWAIGASWGEVSEDDAMAALHRFIDLGGNFIDTADVYGDGRSEQLIARLKRERPQDEIIVATKVGRRLDPHAAAGYRDLARFIERSLKNLETDCLDLVQLHTPPTETFYMPEVFDQMDRFVQQGKIRFYGVSVEKVEEALKAIEYPNVQTVQIIFNMFRQRPAQLFFPQAQQRRVGILARVPLASGLLTGKMTRETAFGQDDHRNFNRHGEAFDMGETFSGVPYETGLDAVEQLRPLVPPGATMAQLALRWILMFEAVSCAIPGAKRPSQVEDNVAAAALPALDQATMRQVEEIYTATIRPAVHHRW